VLLWNNKNFVAEVKAAIVKLIDIITNKKLTKNAEENG
jgi:hypothetical protein